MIASAARLHGRASSRRRLYMRGGRNNNRSVRSLPRSDSIRPRPIFFLTRFLRANRYPLRAKTRAGLRNPRRDLTAQPFQTEQRVGAGLRDLDALGRKMLAEELEMRRTLMELLWRQHRREYRHFGAQLHIHQRLDHGVRDKLMAVDAAIDHEPGRDDRGVAPGLGEQLRVQRDFERARHLEQIDARALDAAFFDLGEE